MAVVVFKEASCKLKSSNGLFLLKGNYELNIIDNDKLKDLRKCNPEFEKWIEKGYVTINESLDNAKADGFLLEKKRAEQMLIDAEKEAQKIVEDAYKKAEEIERTTNIITVTNQSEQVEEQTTDKGSKKNK